MILNLYCFMLSLLRALKNYQIAFWMFLFEFLKTFKILLKFQLKDYDFLCVKFLYDFLLKYFSLLKFSFEARKKKPQKHKTLFTVQPNINHFGFSYLIFSFVYFFVFASTKSFCVRFFSFSFEKSSFFFQHNK